MAQLLCSCQLRNPQTGLSFFGVSLLSPSASSSASSSSSPSASSSASSPHPFLHLLGLSDEDLQKQLTKDHSYAFNMGNNNIIPFKDFKEAVEEHA